MIQPEQFRKWFVPTWTSSRTWAAASRWAASNWTSGAKFAEFEPGRKATLQFADNETTSWELEGSDGKTRLTLCTAGSTRPTCRTRAGPAG